MRMLVPLNSTQITQTLGLSVTLKHRNYNGEQYAATKYIVVNTVILNYLQAKLPGSVAEEMGNMPMNHRLCHLYLFNMRFS